eukprot:gnl/TRDRNA2_/TRDRNA2_195039_c0_seq1.p1 gnl/TRDRNA2_/TRDRNA2_195039_c0~~gnl/TRDRNA2_/TRDRNA2_195039_c0_seq1.p1  ORF type:complete len:134 (+),score=16.42 gnl/TRDRNA2_/TRDRNA2_195039_c0_seq1:34-402(+)
MEPWGTLLLPKNASSPPDVEKVDRGHSHVKNPHVAEAERRTKIEIAAIVEASRNPGGAMRLANATLPRSRSCGAFEIYAQRQLLQRVKVSDMKATPLWRLTRPRPQEPRNVAGGLNERGCQW